MSRIFILLLLAASLANSSELSPAGEAEFFQGRAFLYGEGQEKNDATAAQHFRAAADLGNAKAQHNLALMYAEGRGVVKDEREAVKWLEKASEQGVLRSQLQLGEFYYFGSEKVEKNQAAAAKWLGKAADQKDAQAQYLLGVLYEEGGGVERNPAKAAELFRLSATQGNPRGQMSLGKSYAAGSGVDLNRVEAYYWLKRSVAQENQEAANFLVEFIPLLTPEQVQQGEELLKTRAGP